MRGNENMKLKQPQHLQLIDTGSNNPLCCHLKLENQACGFVFCKQDLAMKTANENNCSVILANDPDSDRMALAEKQPK